MDKGKVVTTKSLNRVFAQIKQSFDGAGLDYVVDEEDVASDEQVTSMLDEVFSEDYVPSGDEEQVGDEDLVSDAEVEAMLDEVFN